MNVELLRYVSCYREKFKIEHYKEKDNIFILVESGSFLVTSETETFQVNALEGVLFRKGIYYNRQINTPVQLHLFRYHSDIDYFENDHVLFTDKSRILSTISLLKHMSLYPCQDTTKFQKNLFIDLINQYIVEHLIFAPFQNKSDSQMEQITNYIRFHIHEKLVITELAYYTKLSYPQFLRRFEAYTGTTPIDYINALKLQKAKDLLIETDYKIKEIAILCGFDNEYYFSNFIKKQTGISPSVFRSQNINMF